MAGVAFGDVAMSLFVAGAIFGDVGMSLFVASAVCGEIWIDSRSTKCYNFRYKMRCRGGKVTSVNGRVQFCNFMLRSCSNRPRTVNDASTQLFSANFS